MLRVLDRLGPRFAWRASGGASDFAHCSESRQSHKAVSSSCRGRFHARSSTDYPFTSSCSPRPDRQDAVSFRCLAGSTARKGLAPFGVCAFPSARAQAILRCSKTPLALWGRKLLARTGQINLVVAAMARKLLMAVWHLMMGRWTPVVEIEAPLETKINKILGQVGADGLKQSGKTRKEWRQEIYQRLKTGKLYYLDPNVKFTPAAPKPRAKAAASKPSAKAQPATAARS